LTLWAYALAAWERPGVSKACLRLQDRHGQCVVLLLWGAWAAIEGRNVDIPTTRSAVALARTWESDVIAPLRAARRALGTAAEVTDDEARDLARAAELDAEHTLMNALEALTPPPSSVERVGGLGRQLAALMGIWNGSRAETLAFSLAAALR